MLTHIKKHISGWIPIWVDRILRFCRDRTSIMCFFTIGDANIYQIKNLFEFPNSVDRILRFCRDGTVPFRRFGGLCRHEWWRSSGEGAGDFFDGQTSKNSAAKGGDVLPLLVFLLLGGCLEHDWLIVMVNIVVNSGFHRLQTNNNRLYINHNSGFHRLYTNNRGVGSTTNQMFFGTSSFWKYPFMVMSQKIIWEKHHVWMSVMDNLGTYPLVNKHRPWKSPIFSGFTHLPTPVCQGLCQFTGG